jgi:hypothetical protein
VVFVPVAVFGVVGSLLSFVLLGRPPATLLGLAFLLTLPALVGYVAAARLQRVQRQEFALRQRLSETNAALQAEIAQRIELQAELERQATTDPLTGLVNRRIQPPLCAGSCAHAARRQPAVAGAHRPGPSSASTTSMATPRAMRCCAPWPG